MAMRLIDLMILGGAFVATASAAAGPAAKAGDPAAIKPLLDCRRVVDRDARLACFDRESEAIATAIDRKDVVVANHQEITKARRSLFGFSKPGVDMFNKNQTRGEAKVEQGVNVIDATITSVFPDPYGHWTLVLDDGARWKQIDEEQMARDPRPGMKIHVRRAAMGSFLANVDGQTAIRVRRVN